MVAAAAAPKLELSEKEKGEFDHITYDAIESMTDVAKLKKLERYMEQEGFPQTAQVVQGRLRELGVRGAPQPADIMEVLESTKADLKSWVNELSQQEKKLKEKDAVPSRRDTGGGYPPVRSAAPANDADAAGAGASTSSGSLEAKKKDSNFGNGKVRSGKEYYEAWDKFADQAAKATDAADGHARDTDSRDTGTGGLGPGPKFTERFIAMNRDKTAAEREALANEEKAKGNEAFRAKEYAEAVECYTRAIGLSPAIGTTAALLHGNRAATYLKLKLWDLAETDCELALRHDGAFAKGFMRRAAARLELGKLEGALADCDSVLALVPDNKEALALRAQVEKKLDAKSLKRMVVEEVEDEDEGDDAAGAGVSANASAAVAAAPAGQAPPDFIASTKWTGAKAGYAFKKGDKGQGYYLDPLSGPVPAPAPAPAPTASAPAAALPGNRTRIQVVEASDDSSEDEAGADAAQQGKASSVSGSSGWGSGGPSPKDKDPAAPADANGAATRKKIAVVEEDSDSEAEAEAAAPPSASTATATSTANKATSKPEAVAAASTDAGAAAAADTAEPAPPAPASFDVHINSVKERGNVALKEGKLVQATQAYGEALELAPNSAVLYNNRSLARLKAGLAAEALRDAAQAVALEPTNFKSWHRRAAAKRKLRLYRSAQEDVERSMSLVAEADKRMRGELAKELAEVVSEVKAAEARAKARAEAEAKAKAKAKASTVSTSYRNGLVIEEVEEEEAPARSGSGGGAKDGDAPLMSEEAMAAVQREAEAQVAALNKRAEQARAQWEAQAAKQAKEAHTEALVAWRIRQQKIQEARAAAAPKAVPAAAEPAAPAASKTAAPAAAPAAAAAAAAGPSVDELKQKGNAAFAANDLAGAAAAWEACLRMDPANTAVHLNMALLRIKTDEPTAALHHCAQVLAVDPANLKALHRRGLAHKALGQLDEAAEALRAARARMGVSPQLDAELEEVGRMQLARREQQEKENQASAPAPVAVAGEAASSSVAATPSSSSAALAPQQQRRKVVVQEESDDEEEAVKPAAIASVAQTPPAAAATAGPSSPPPAATASIASAPTPAPTPAQTTRVKVAVQDGSDSEEEDTAAASPAPSPAPAASATSPRQAINAPATPPAVATTSEPDNVVAADAARMEGNDAYRVGNMAAALEAYTRSITLCAHNPASYCNRALLHLKCGRPTEAAADARAALAQDPTYHKAKLRLASALTDLGQLQEARTLHVELLAALPNDPILAKDAAALEARIKAQKQAEQAQAQAEQQARQLASASTSGAALAAAAGDGARRKKVVVEEASDDDDDEQQPSASAAATSTTTSSTAKPASPAVVSALQPAEAGRSSSPAAAAEAAVKAAKLHSIASAKAAAALAAAAAAGPKRPPPPKSALDFETAIKSLAGHDAALADYVRSVEPASYAAVFKQALSDKVVTGVLAAAKEADDPAALAWASEALAALAGVPRFALVYGMMGRAAKADAAAVVAALEGAGRDVAQIKAAYRV